MRIKELEQQVDLVELILKDYQLKRVGEGTYRINPCPICGKNDHFTINAKENYYKSFNGCCKGGGPYDYLTEIKKLTKEAAYQELKRLAGVMEETYKKRAASNAKPTTQQTNTPYLDYTPIVNKLYNAQSEEDKKYFINRGMTNEVIEKYKLCIGEVNNLGSTYKDKRAIIPIWQGDKVVYWNARALKDIKPKYIKAAGQAVFLNIDYLQTAAKDEIIVLTEGEFDALSLEVIGIKAIAIGGVTNFNNFLKKLEREDLIIATAFDNDEEGQKVEWNYKIEIPQQYKDLNEWLVANKEEFETIVKIQLKAIREMKEQEKQKEIEEYKKNSVGNYIDVFLDGIKESANTPAIPTGFEKLDNVLEGGLYEGLYVLGAISSLGKTTFTLQIGDQIAQQGYDVLIFSLEMARTELMAKSISRLTFLLADSPKDAKTTRGITAGQRYKHYSDTEKALIRKAVAAYGEYADNIYIHEGIGDIGANEIRETVKKHIEITGNKPVVIIDYIQLLAPYSEKLTDKQNMDKSIMELKRISRDYKIPIIGISSFNRDNYSMPVNMAAFKESGAIEYSSDVLIGLQFKGAGTKTFDADEEKKKDPREIELKILKNRNGRTGEIIEFQYYPLFNYYREVGKKDNRVKVI